MEKNDEDLKKVCGACNKKLAIKWFYRSKFGRDGYEARCKVCKKVGKTIRKPKEKTTPNPKYQFKLNSPTIEDYRDMFLFLKSMGYSLDKDIHQQFCEKYNLRPKKRPFKAGNRFTLKDIFG